MSDKKANSKSSQGSKDSEDGAKEEQTHEICGQSIPEFSKSGFSLIVEATKAVNSFPSGASRDLYCAYPVFGKVIDAQTNHILGIISQVLKQQNVRGNIQRREEDEQFDLLLDCNDAMLERINSNLDELSGIRKKLEPILVESKMPVINQDLSKSAGSWNLKKTNSPTNQTARLITAKNIARPQVAFKVPVDNNPSKPFEPRLNDKPHSIKPLAILPEYDEDGNIESYLHPYEFELDKFQPPQHQLEPTVPQLPKNIDNTPFLFVDTECKLKQLVDEINKETEIAVDLEHHSYRTFQGFACLMQISTRKKDYIIDALRLREELHILNNVFTDPKILKIFHGADSDIQWLQRDLSLYVVNMFDTHQAAKLMAYPRLSLAYLLKHYCGIEADKTFQLADWRIRPLPEELISYARQDTHFLIYIADMIRNDLLKLGNNQPNFLKIVYQKSTELCKKRYIKPKINADSYVELYRKSKRIFDNRQLFALKEIFLWRDKTARMEDESYGYVLPNHMMLQISESLPREMQGILACCNPIPPLVRQHLHALHQIILKAREQPLVKPIIDEAIENRVALPVSGKDYDSKLNCPHDLSHTPEFRDDLETLLGSTKAVEEEDVDRIEIAKPVINVFEINKRISVAKTLILEKLKEVKFITPYERYKAVIPFAEKQKLEELEKQQKESENKILCPVKEEPMDNEEKPQEESSKKKDDDDLFLKPLKQSVKRKRKKSTTDQSEQPVLPKKAKDTDLVGGDDKLHFIEMPKIEKESKAKKKKRAAETVFSIKVNSDEAETSKNVETNGDEISRPVEGTSNTIIVKSNKRKNKKKFQNKTGQSSTQPVQFDYSKVDFKKFQGGAQKAKGTEIKAKFHGKGNNNKVKNKKFNKLFTFSDVGNKKK